MMHSLMNKVRTIFHPMNGVRVSAMRSVVCLSCLACLNRVSSIRLRSMLDDRCRDPRARERRPTEQHHDNVTACGSITITEAVRG